MTTAMIESKQTQANEVHTCCNCDNTGAGITGNYYWIGGKGDVLIYECQDCLNARRKESLKACETLRLALIERGN
jgi:hypothetical protein